jgi:hypothetical protein
VAAPERPAARRRGRRTDDEAAENVGVLQSAIAAWRGLAEERAAEIATLRDEVRRLQELLVAQRRTVAPLGARHRQRV